MRQATIAELKAKLSEYVAAAKAGEMVIVTERGRPVARLVPLEPESEIAARAAALVRAGVLARPAAALGPAALRTAERPADPEARLLAALLAEREEER